ncbi:MAG: hypothetical protein ACTTKL_09435 [Treponema sp.]
MGDTDRNVYLNLEIRKSAGKTDEFGNYIFEVEASNENVDLQDQIVLQNALMESKDEFLRGGVVSYDHLHKQTDANGVIISDPSMVIGEPIDVEFDTKTKSTVVKGKLYATNEKAKEIIKMLKAGSTRVRASIGGIFPKVVKNAETGIETITHVLWNDLALTVAPVNNLVGSATLVKSLSAKEFVSSLPLEIKKSLSAGYGTDANAMNGGRALIPENVGGQTIEAASTNAFMPEEQAVISELLAALEDGNVEGNTAAELFLRSKGIEKARARAIVREIIEQGGEMMKKSFSDAVGNLLKSLTGAGKGDDDELKKSADDGVINVDDPDDKNGGDEGDDGKKKKKKPDDDGNGSDDGDGDGTSGDDDDEAIDGTALLKSLDMELSSMRKSLKAARRQINDLGNAVVNLAQMVAVANNAPLPPSSVLAKSMTGAQGKAQNAVPNGRPSEQDLKKAQVILADCTKNGVIDVKKSSMILSDLQKCMSTGKPMNPEYYQFLQKEFAKEAK